MLNVLLFILLAALSVAGAWWVAGLPGTVSATIGSYSIDASAPVALTLLAVLFVLLYAAVRLIFRLFGAPRRIARVNRRMRRVNGEQAVTRALVALAANDPEAAGREAARSQKLLGATPLTLLLAGQAHRQAGNDDKAAEVFKQLADTKGGAFLGHRGLMQIATGRQDWTTAQQAALGAENAYPGAAWVKQERQQIALKTGQFREALSLSAEGKAALAIAAANAETDPAQSIKLAKQAFDTDPALPPAAIAYATRLRQAGREKAAQSVIARAWAQQPHPDLADLALAPQTDRLKRVAEARQLATGNPAHVESRLIVARAALAAGLSTEARRELNAARKAGLNQRRMYVLMADVAELDGNAAEAQEALRAESSAAPDPVWRCGACSTVQPAWTAVCPACGTHGRVAWVAAAADAPVVAQMPAPRTLDAITG